MTWQPEFFRRSERFAPIAAAASRFAGFRAWPAVEEIDRRLAADAGVRFVAAEKGPGYAARIVEQREVPTRPGSWHDFLNALVWAAFPRAKRALTARLHALAALRGGGNRGREEDFLALWDEGGVAVVDGGAEVVFGHAVYEHLVRGESVRGLALAVAGGAAPLDARIAEVVSAPFGARASRVVVAP
ncbi:MAG TPA: DUF3025 domain-containing protein [Haliangiales bacterium]|nr:DUF3025 domain-containing protein [Haliangiales bacterium]